MGKVKNWSRVKSKETKASRLQKRGDSGEVYYWKNDKDGSIVSVVWRSRAPTPVDYGVFTKRNTSDSWTRKTIRDTQEEAREEAVRLMKNNPRGVE